MGKFDIKNYKEPRRFRLRFYDTKVEYETFAKIDAAKMFMASLKFLKSHLEIYDSKAEKTVYAINGGRRLQI